MVPISASTSIQMGPRSMSQAVLAVAMAMVLLATVAVAERLLVERWAWVLFSVARLVLARVV